MQRIFLFLLTNIAIMVILSVTLRVLGVESLLAQNGSDLDLNALVIFSGIFGFGTKFNTEKIIYQAIACEFLSWCSQFRLE